MTRQQLEDVIDRQLAYQHAGHSESCIDTLDASRRAILAAVDDWAASQVAAAVTPPPPADVIPLQPAAMFTSRRKLTRRTLRRFSAQLARALGTTTGGTR